MNSSGSAFQKMVYKRLFSCFDVIIANSMDVRDDVLAEWFASCRKDRYLQLQLGF